MIPRDYITQCRERALSRSVGDVALQVRRLSIGECA